MCVAQFFCNSLSPVLYLFVCSECERVSVTSKWKRQIRLPQNATVKSTVCVAVCYRGMDKMFERKTRKPSNNMGSDIHVRNIFIVCFGYCQHMQYQLVMVMVFAIHYYMFVRACACACMRISKCIFDSIDRNFFSLFSIRIMGHMNCLTHCV